MASPSDKQLATSRGWAAGIDNLNPEQALTRDEDGNVIAVRDAQNVDLDRHGKAARRAGYRKLIATAHAHSLWSDPAFPLALYVDGDALRAMRDDAVPFTVRNGMGVELVSFAETAGFAWWASPSQHGRVSADGDALDWGVVGPAGQPVLVPTASGGLCAGRYQIAVTFLTAAGEESGTPLAAWVDVPDGGGIALTGIPQPAGQNQRIRVYASSANGDGLYFVVDWPVGAVSGTIGAHAAGRPLTTQFLEPMPCGHIVRWQNARLYVATGADVVFSEALRYGLTDPAHNRLGFGARVAMLEPVGAGGEGAGLFIAAGAKTYWTGGVDPKAFNLRIVYAHGAVPGTSIRLPGNVFGLETTEPVAYWLADNGVGCIGLPGGQVMPLRENQTIAPAASGGTSLYRDTGGLRQVVTTLVNASPRGLAIADKLDCEVYRHD
jgi:hypothetical protein